MSQSNINKVIALIERTLTVTPHCQSPAPPALLGAIESALKLIEARATDDARVLDLTRQVREALPCAHE
jgi:hypothetical protein